ncbi:MAG TPA: acyltransferase [Bryobacteraceae bacterium]|nr:acyltransferase [Bryobacteraceae bacterium]
MLTSVLEKPESAASYRRSTFSGESTNLDLIRAVAVLCVFFGHLATYRHEGLNETAWHFAQMGVLIFFVHTSFVLMLSLERSVEKNGSNYLFRDFYTRRFFRIYPLAVFCVLVAYFTHGATANGEPRYWTPYQLISNLTLTTNLTYSDIMVGGLWTLPLEVQMYIVLPIVFLVVRGRAIWYAIVIWGASVPFALLQPHISERLNVLAYAPCFLGGILAWRLSRSVKRRVNGWFWPLAFVATWTFFLIADREHDMIYRYIFSLSLGLAIPHFAELKAGWFGRLVHLVAKYSYGIYLSHLGIMMFMGKVNEPYRWPLLVLLAVICPVAMYHFIEAPFISLGQRIARRYRGRESNKVLVQPTPVSIENPEPGI